MFMRIMKKIIIGIMLLIMGLGVIMLGTMCMIAKGCEEKEPEINYVEVSETIMVNGQECTNIYTVGITNGLN